MKIKKEVEIFYSEAKLREMLDIEQGKIIFIEDVRETYLTFFVRKIMRISVRLNNIIYYHDFTHKNFMKRMGINPKEMKIYDFQTSKGKGVTIIYKTRGLRNDYETYGDML